MTKKKPFNYHLYLEHTDLRVDAEHAVDLRCLFCGQHGDFFTMHQDRCPHDYPPCPECGSADDSNDCKSDCDAKFLGLRLPPPGQEAPKREPVASAVADHSHHFHPRNNR